MVTLHIDDKKIECAEVNPVKLKMLITEGGQEYLLMNDWGQQHLYTVHRGKGDRPDFTYIDKAVTIKVDPLSNRTSIDYSNSSL